jgi:hypothetical protein
VNVKFQGIYSNASMNLQKEKDVLVDWHQIFSGGYYQLKFRIFDDIDNKINDFTAVVMFKKN